MDFRSLPERLQRRLSPAGPDEGENEALPPPRVPDHELLKQIGSGSYGGVWLARSAGGQLRAVKAVWRSRFSSDRPFEREFNGIRQFEPISRSHPGVVAVLHIGRDDPSGCFYYVMELADPVGPPLPPGGGPASGAAPASLPGALEQYEPRTLASDLRTRGRLSLTEVLTLGVQLADALGHLHRHRLVHRDVKPSNVIFIGGQARLADIGLVTGADEAMSFVGTEGFIPPEGPGTPQADIFGLGRLLYQAATGKDRCDFPDLPDDLDAWDASEREGLLELNEILVRACAPLPSQRHANTAELAGDLNLLLAGRSVRRAYGVERRLRRATRLIGAAVVVVLLAVAAVWSQKARRQQAEARAAHEAVLRERAERAEQRSREQLRDTLLHQALALLGGSEPERRSRALAALEQAGGIRSGLDLRNAAIAALATPQVRVIRQWSPRAAGSIESRPDAVLRRYMRRQLDGSVTVHAMDDDRELLRLAGAGVVADFGAFSPDGSRLAVKYSDGMLRIWDLDALSDALLIPKAIAFVFSPEGRWLVASCEDRHLHLFDLTAGREAVRRDVPYVATFLAVHPTDPIFLAGAYGRAGLEIRRLQDGAVLRNLPLGEMGLAGRWSADGGSLITTHLDFSVRVWDWPSASAPRLILRFHRAEPFTLATDPTGRWLVSSGWDSKTAFFDLRDGRLLLSQTGSSAHGAADRPAFLLINAAGWRLVEFEPAFAVEAIRLHRRHKSPTVVAFSPTGTWLASGGPDGIRLLDWRTREVHTLLDGQKALSVAFSADSTRLYALGPDRLLAWRLDADRPAGRPSARPVAIPPWTGELPGEIGTASLSAGAERWVAAVTDPSAPGSAWLLGRPGVAGIERLDGRTPGAVAPELSRDGMWLAWGNWQRSDAGAMRLDAGAPPVAFPVSGSATVAFSPDSRLLAVGGPDEIDFYEVGSWRRLHSVPRRPSGPLPPQVAFTGDSRLCAAALPPDRVLLIDTASGEELGTLPAGEHILARLAFSPDSRHLAVTSTDHHVLIWDIGTLQMELGRMGLGW